MADAARRRQQRRRRSPPTSWARHALAVDGSPLPGRRAGRTGSRPGPGPRLHAPADALAAAVPDRRSPRRTRWRPLVWATCCHHGRRHRRMGADAVLRPGLRAAGGPRPGRRCRSTSKARTSCSWSSLPVFLACIVLSLASLAVRWRPRGAAERDQLRWILLAAVLFLCLIAIALSLPTYVPGFVAVASIPLPVAIALGILRRGLWQLDLALNRSLVYGGLTLAVVTVYAVVVLLVGWALGGVTENQKIAAVVDRGDGGPAAARAAAARRQPPALRRPRRAVDRRTPARRPAGRGDPPADVMPAVVETVARTLRAAVRRRSRCRVARPVARGEPIGALIRGPARCTRGATSASLSVYGPSAARTVSGRRERALLERLAARGCRRRACRRPAGGPPALPRAAGAVARGGAQAAAPGPARRPGPGARRHRDEARGDPRGAARRSRPASGSLDAATATLRSSVAGVRRIVDDLRPPSLDGLGLVGAPCASSWTSSPTPACPPRPGRAGAGRPDRRTARGGRRGGVPDRLGSRHQRAPARVAVARRGAAWTSPTATSC